MRFVEHTLFSAVALTTNGGIATSAYIDVFGAPFAIVQLWDSAGGTAKTVGAAGVDVMTTVQGCAAIASFTGPTTGMYRHQYGFSSPAQFANANIRTGLAFIIGGTGFGDGASAYAIAPTVLPFNTMAIKVTSDTSTNTMTLNGKLFVARPDPVTREVATV